MAKDRGAPDSGSYRLLQPTPEALELQNVSRRLFVASSSEEIVRILSEAARKLTGARSVSVFLHDPETGSFAKGDPALLPETAVVDFIFADSKPLVIPHREGTFITVFPLMVEHRRMGLLVLAGAAMIAQLATSNTLLQLLAPAELRGRVVAFFMLAFMGMAPLGSLLAGVIARQAGTPTAVLGGGVVCLATAVWFGVRLATLRRAATGRQADVAAD